jgi:fumiquinazoline A oxidase
MFNATGPQSFNESIITFADLPAKSAGGAFTLSCGKGLRKNNYSVNMKNFNLTTMRFVFDQYTNFLAANPNANQSAWLIEVFGQEGENAFPTGSSAYPNRGFDNIRPIIGATYSDDSVAEAADQYLQTVRNACAATSGYGKLRVYQNYAHGDEPLAAMYGYEKGRLQKLQCLKAKYDPNDVFKGYHGIPMPAKGSC